MPNQTISYYEKNAETVSARYESAQVEDLHAQLLHCFNGRSDLLELGTGSGREAAFLVKNGFSVKGIEASPEMISQAEALHPELRGALLCFELPGRLPFPDNSFDGVFSIATLMHLPQDDIRRVISEASRVLKSGGRFFFSVSLCRSGLDESGHDKQGRYFCCLPQEKWLDICQTAGFTIINTSELQDGIGRQEMTWFTAAAEKKG